MSLYESFGHVARIVVLICAVVSVGYLIYVAAQKIDEILCRGEATTREDSSVQRMALDNQWTGGIWAGSVLADVLILSGTIGAIFCGTQDFLSKNPNHGQAVVAMLGVFALFPGLLFFKVFGRSLRSLYHQTTAFVTHGTLLDPEPLLPAPA